jgi:hypothetical protein
VKRGTIVTFDFARASVREMCAGTGYKQRRNDLIPQVQIPRCETFELTPNIVEFETGIIVRQLSPVKP